MKWAAVFLGVLATVGSAGCWRPYYGQRYAQPAYPQAPVYSQPTTPYAQPPIVQSVPQSQPAPIVQSMPMVQQSPLVQGCPPVNCQPCVPCTPCY